MDVFSGERLRGYRTNPPLMNGLVDVNGEVVYDALEGSKCDKLELGNDPNFVRNLLADGSYSSQTRLKQGHVVFDSPVMRPQPINDQAHDCRRPVSCTGAGHHSAPLCCPPNAYYRHNFCPADLGCTNHRQCERTHHQNCDPPNRGYIHTNCDPRHPVYHQHCAQVDQRHHGNCAQVDQRHHGNCGQTNQGCQVDRGCNHDCNPPQRHPTSFCCHQHGSHHHVGHHVHQQIDVEGKLRLMPCPENAPMNLRFPVQTISSQHNTQQIQLSGGYCSTLLPVGKIIQIWGPPMAGKSTFIDQKISESRKIHTKIIYHSFNCKNLSSVHDVLMKVCMTLNPQVHACQCEPNSILGLIISVMQAHPGSHHVLVFHKCESLRSRGYDNEFMTYLSEVSAASQSTHLKVTIYFTTYKRFPVSGRAIDLIQVGMLTDFDKIIAMLKKYAPGVYVNDYAYICQRYLCLPEAVVRLAQEYLSQEECMPSAELLEHIAANDINFLALIFEKRVGEVSGWVQREDFELISCFSHCLLSTTSQEHIEAVYSALHPDHSRARWPLCLKRLLDDNILRRLPEVDRLAVHPLIVYCCKVVRLGGLMLFRDPMVNSYCTFLCHVLAKAELNITLHGRKGEVFGCLLNEWPHVRHLLEMAVHCQAGTYPAFLRVAVVARRLLVCCFPNEAKQFYNALYQSSQVLGTPSQRAVLQACLGHSLANSAVVDWESAEHHLQSAVTELKTHGPIFFYKWALTRLAILAQRTGDSKRSLEYFSKVKAVRCQKAFVTDKLLEVSQLQIQEAEVSAEVHGATPMIFSGNIAGARQQLMRLLEDPEVRIERHPEFPVLLNSLGLIEERATGNIRGALVWYIRSYRERLYLEKIIPHYVMVSLNNIAMVLYRLGQFSTCNQYLMKAIEIQRRRGWTHHDTALTLIHLGEIKVRQGDFMESFKYNQEAENILSHSVKYNDSRLRVNMALVHLKAVLKQDAGLLTGADPDDHNAVFDTTVASHIEAMVAISQRVSDHLSVDGHHFVMLTYEHGVRINCRRDPVKTREHSKALLKHVQENAYVRDVINSRDEAAPRDNLIAKHRGFYFYIQRTLYESLDLKILTELLYESCGHCKALTTSRDHDIWEGEIDERQQTKVKEQLTQNIVSSQSGSDQTMKKEMSVAGNEDVTERGHVDKPQVSLIKGDPIMQPDQTINKAPQTIDQPSLLEVPRTVPEGILHNPVHRFEMGSCASRTAKALELFVKEQDVMAPGETADVQSRSVGNSCAPDGMVTAMHAERCPKELELFVRQQHVLEPAEAHGVRYSSRDSPLLGRMGTANFSVHPESEASSQSKESFKDSMNSRD